MPHNIGSRTVTLAVRHFPQLRNYWCGPATALQTLDFSDRTAANSTTQAAIASGMGSNLTQGGTDIPTIVNAVHSRTSNRRLIHSRITNQTAIGNNILLAIDHGITPIVRFETVSSANWIFSIGFGNFANVSGMSTDNSGFVSHVQLTDAWVGSQWFRPGTSGTYWVTLQNLTNAMNTGGTRVNFAW